MVKPMSEPSNVLGSMTPNSTLEVLYSTPILKLDSELIGGKMSAEKILGMSKDTEITIAAHKKRERDYKVPEIYGRHARTIPRCFTTRDVLITCLDSKKVAHQAYKFK